MASAHSGSSLRALLPPPARPVQSSRLTHRRPGARPRAAPSRSAGLQRRRQVGEADVDGGHAPRLLARPPARHLGPTAPSGATLARRVSAVLFKQRLWPGMRDGSIAVTFRRWKRSQATPGRRYRTGAGLIEVDTVDVVGEAVLTDDAARAGRLPRPGHAGRRARQVPRRRPLPHHVPPRRRGPAPRPPRGRRPHRRRPRRHRRPAGPLRPGQPPRPVDPRRPRRHRRPARRCGPATWPTRWAATGASFKVDVRKLKELGLTESLEVGYRLSPRGGAVLDRLAAGRDPPARWGGRQRPKAASHASAERGLNT